jgi:glutamyl-tRNA reductase
VTGESQITGQVKGAYELAQGSGATGFYLNKLFHRALAVSKRVRRETGIGRGTVSVGSAAVLLARKIFGSLADRMVLLVGAGKVGELCVRYLHGQAVGRVNIVNRTLQHALTLEQGGLGVARPWEDLETLMRAADVLITSVAGQPAEFAPERLARIMQERAQAPLFIIDLGVPRNVPAGVGGQGNVYLYNIDDLKAITDQHQGVRRQETLAAKFVIAEEVRLFYEGTLADPAGPAIARLGRKFERVREQELARTLARLKHLKPEEREAIDRLTRSLTGRILHDPILSLKDRQGLSEPRLLEIFKRMFKLDEEG